MKVEIIQLCIVRYQVLYRVWSNKKYFGRWCWAPWSADLIVFYDTFVIVVQNYTILLFASRTVHSKLKAFIILNSCQHKLVAMQLYSGLVASLFSLTILEAAAILD